MIANRYIIVNIGGYLGMDDAKEKMKRDKLLQTCAWCYQEIPADSESYGFGAKASQDVDLDDKEGEFVSLDLALEEKTTFAMVPPRRSPAREAGFDLMFITCSQDCAEDLKSALEIEKDIFKSLKGDQ